MTRPRVEELELGTIAQGLADPTGAAFVQLYRRYEPVVRWAVGCRVLRWPELVPSFEDVLQDSSRSNSKDVCPSDVRRPRTQNF